MKTLQEILAKLVEIKPELVNKYGVSQLAIFGSYAYGQANENSDVDVLVDFNRSIGIEFIDLCEDIEISLGIKTDIATVGALRNKPKLFEFIKKDLIYV